MRPQIIQKIKALLRATVAVGTGMAALVAIAAFSDRTPPSPHTVNIAFGFHVNLFHSFRNDSNDEAGFGKDIRVIRHIIETLDRYNEQGVPVRGVWDFDNLFSLQEILPRYAPDIIASIKRRVQHHGDEVILMSYNNGMASAMTGRELDDATAWAISNPWGSGVKDIFGTYSPIVRPQEMMTTPGNFSIYKKHGIHAVSLYYSATPFDTFRVFSRALTPTEAHNPLLYRHPGTGEEMVVIPSYNIGDLVENVSLRKWVNRLRGQQERGELNGDALIFINYDADSDFWSGVDLPWPLEMLPNTDGLAELIHSVHELPHVRFTTLQKYLATHPPRGNFYFGQDTADGSFNGYNSWSEKAAAHRHWTVIQRNRRMQGAARKAMSAIRDRVDRANLASVIETAYLKRLRALSTTNFGMATPHVSPDRERTMAALMHELDRLTDEMARHITRAARDTLKNQREPAMIDTSLSQLDTLMVIQPHKEIPGSRFIKLPVPGDTMGAGALFLMGENGKKHPLISLGDVYEAADGYWIDVFVEGQEGLGEGKYGLFSRQAPSLNAAVPPLRGGTREKRVRNDRIRIDFSEKGRVEGVFLDGMQQLDAGSLLPSLRHGDLTLQGIPTAIHALTDASGMATGLRIQGDLPGPPGITLADGHFDYTLGVVAQRPYVLVRGRIAYPRTARRDIIKAEFPELSRRVDMRWREVAPAEIRFSSRATRQDPIRILKRNFLNIDTEYSADYFRHSRENLNLDNLNNHVTEAYVGLTAGGRGMAVAMDTSVLANFAFAPLRVTHESGMFRVRANPFGTYHGRQYRPPTRGNGQGFEVALLSGEQFHSAAPTYNGADQSFSLLLAFFDGREMPSRIQSALLSFAHPPLVVSYGTDAVDPVSPASLGSADKLWASHGRTPSASSPGISSGAAPIIPAAPIAIPFDLKIRVLWANLTALFSG